MSKEGSWIVTYERGAYKDQYVYVATEYLKEKTR